MKKIDEIAREIGAGISRASTAISSSTDQELDDAQLGDPNCPICRGVGYVRLDVPVHHPDFGKLFPCTCRREELQSRRHATMRSMSSLKILERYTFENFRPDGHGLSAERQRNLRLAYNRAVAYAQRPEGWLLIRGGYGCGKTHLAAAIANDAIARGTPVLFVTVPDLLDHLRGAYAPTATQRYDERFEEVRMIPLLIMDDLGTEHGTPWALEKLYQLLNYRYMARLPTVITTNNSLDELDPRLCSRLGDTDLVDMVTILAPDYRQTGTDYAKMEMNTLVLYGDMRFDNFLLRQGELAREELNNLRRAVELAKGYAANPIDWLIFTGDYGCGKTHLAAAIANQRVKEGHPALFVTVPDFLDYLRASFYPQSAVPYDKRFEEVRNAPFLVLDDLGTEYATPWAQEKLYQLFNYRYVARLPTVITSSRTLEEIDPRIGTRLADVSRCTVFSIMAPSYRGGPTRR
ncbi:MAG: ATP-binding protein, partial [Anaerolineales bacterium]